MLALESSRPRGFSQEQQLPFDSAMMNPFSYQNVQQELHGLPHTQDSANAMIAALYDSIAFVESSSDMGNGTSLSTPPPMASHFSVTSGASVASSSSSAMSSPYSGDAQAFPESWMDTNHGLGLTPAVMDEFVLPDVADASVLFNSEKFPEGDVVDPSMLQQFSHQVSIPSLPFADGTAASLLQQPERIPASSAAASPMPDQHTTSMPPTSFTVSSPLPVNSPQPSSTSVERPPSVTSVPSLRSHQSPAVSSHADGEEEGREKGRCPFPDCGRTFRDLKAHMLTHQSERPEKCPIVTCAYHHKGFARKYDKNRHTLTHYKGTMVCGFCPGSGSPAEKSFNRADVFKRHLMSVHGVEQTPPNCRRRSPTSASAAKSLSAYGDDATGKCSTCAATFANPQDFYEHLDDCVLRVVQQEEPSESINQQRLAEVADDAEVKKTLERHNLTDSVDANSGTNDEENNNDNDNGNDGDDSSKNDGRSGKGSIKPSKPGANSAPKGVLAAPNTAVTKTGKPRAVVTRRRGNRNFYPHSWGTPASKMKVKKRVLCVYDGQRRLWKDEMMLNNDLEVRIRLPNGPSDGAHRNAYVTHLDVETLRRAEGVFSATEEERGPWVPDGSNRMIGQPLTVLPGIPSGEDHDTDDFRKGSC